MRTFVDEGDTIAYFAPSYSLYPVLARNCAGAHHDDAAAARGKGRGHGRHSRAFAEGPALLPHHAQFPLWGELPHCLGRAAAGALRRDRGRRRGLRGLRRRIQPSPARRLSAPGHRADALEGILPGRDAGRACLCPRIAHPRDDEGEGQLQRQRFRADRGLPPRWRTRRTSGRPAT